MNNIAAGRRLADSSAKVQAALLAFSPLYLSASQMLQPDLGCSSFIPGSTSNTNLSEFCDPKVDAEINHALAAESDNSPDVAALWAQADRTATDDAPVVALATPSETDFVSARVGDYQYSFQQGVLLDQLWVR